MKQLSCRSLLEGTEVGSYLEVGSAPFAGLAIGRCKRAVLAGSLCDLHSHYRRLDTLG